MGFLYINRVESVLKPIIGQKSRKLAGTLLVATLLTVPSMGWAASQMATRGMVELVYMDKTQTEDHPATEYIEKLDSEIMKKLRFSSASNKMIPLRIEVAPVLLDQPFEFSRQGNSSVVMVSNNLDELILEREFQRQLCAIIILSKANIRPEDGLTKFPMFIVDGILANQRVSQDRDAVLNVLYYPAIRTLMDSGKRVDIRELLADLEGVGGSNDATTAFADEIARFGVDMFTTGGASNRNLLLDFIVFRSENRSFNECFDSTIGNLLVASNRDLPKDLAVASNREKIDYLVNLYVDARVYNSYNPRFGLDSQAIFTQFKQFEYQDPTTNEIKKADILELPAVYELYPEVLEEVFLAKQRELLLLRKTSSSLLESGLQLCVDSLVEIGKKSKEEATKQLKTALETTDAAIECQVLLDAKLDELEGSELNLPESAPALFRQAEENTKENFPIQVKEVIEQNERILSESI